MRRSSPNLPSRNTNLADGDVLAVDAHGTGASRASRRVRVQFTEASTEDDSHQSEKAGLTVKERLTAEFHSCEDPSCLQPGCRATEEATETADFQDNSRFRVPFSQKMFVKANKDKTFPKQYHEYLEQPTNIIYQMWDLEGKRIDKTVKQARTLTRIVAGLPEKWLRRRVVKEMSGEVLVDEFKPLDGKSSTRKIALLTNNINQVLLLKNKDGKWELPSGPVDRVAFQAAVEKKTGVKLQSHNFSEFFHSATGTYMSYKYPVGLDKTRFEGNRNNPELNLFTDFMWVGPTTIPPEKMHEIEERTDDFLNLCGEKIAEVVNQKAMCSCAECDFGFPSRTIVAPEYNELYSFLGLEEEEELEDEWLDFYNVPAYFSADRQDSYQKIEIRSPQFEVSAGPWAGLDSSALWFTDLPLIALSEEEMKKEVLTREGLKKLHLQWFHLQEKELFKRIEMFVPDEKRSEILALCRSVVWGCEACRKHRKTQHRPKIGGLWAHNVGDIVACDTFKIRHPQANPPKDTGGKLVAVMHMIDLFSGYSIWSMCEGPEAKPCDVIEVFRKWTDRFGVLPRCFFSDQGGEFTGHETASYLHSQGVKHIFSPPQAPYTNGINERHNGILKIWIKRIQADKSASKLSLVHILREACRVKNATTRRHGYSATFLAFGYKPEDELQVSLQDMLDPGTNPDPNMRARLQARAAAQRAVSEYTCSQKITEALTKNLQNTDKKPLSPGTFVDYHVEPDSLKSAAYWEPNCKVLRQWVGDEVSTKKVLIMRPGGIPQMVARHRVRPSSHAACIQLNAIDLNKSDWEISKTITEGLEKEKQHEKEIKQSKESVAPSNKAVKDSENPNVEQTIVDFLQERKEEREQFADFITSQTELNEKQAEYHEALSAVIPFGTGNKNMSRKEQNILRQFSEKFRPPSQEKHETRKKKKKKLRKEESSDDEDSRNIHTSLLRLGNNPNPLRHPPKSPSVPSENGSESELEKTDEEAPTPRPPRVRLQSPRPSTPSTPPRSPRTSESPQRKRAGDRSASPSPTRRTPSPASSSRFPVERSPSPARSPSPERRSSEKPKKKKQGREPEGGKQKTVEEQRTKDPYDRHWAVDRMAHNRDRSETSPHARTSARLKSYRERGLEEAQRKAVEEVKERNKTKFKRLSAVEPPTAEDVRANEQKATKYNFRDTPRKEKKSVRQQVSDIEEVYDKHLDELGVPPPPPAGGHRGPGDPVKFRDLLEESEAQEQACERFEVDTGSDTDDGENDEKKEGEAKAVFGPKTYFQTFGEEQSEESDQETIPDRPQEVDTSDFLPKNFFVETSEEGDPLLTLWQDDPSLEQVLIPDGVFDKWIGTYPAIYSYFGNLAKVRIRAGKEIPRVDALKDQEFWRAMEREFDQLITNGCSFVKPPQAGAKFVYSSRWVYTYKEDGTRKARVVVRGFEEAWDPSAEDHATDSPTLDRDSIRLICLTAAHHRWRVQSWDIKTAFQQAMTKDDPDQTMSEAEGLLVYLPKWMPHKYDEHLLAGRTCVKIPAGKTLYGMASAPRRWFFTLRKVMHDCGFETSKSDDCLFLHRDKAGEVDGMAGWHVDDGLLAGKADFWAAMENVAKKLKFGKKVSDDFRFCGMQITQDKTGTIKLNQKDMIASLEHIPLGPHRRQKTDSVTPEEVTAMRGRIGSMLYLTGNTRPLEAYAVSHLSGFVTEAKVVHLQNINALVDQFKASADLGIIYKGGCSVDVMYTFHDSSFKSERDSGSQMGILNFVGPIVNEKGEVDGASLVRWASKRARRVCHSTMAAETLAATAGLDSQAGLLFRLQELGFSPRSVMLTDCRSLYDHIYAMTGKTAEMLLPDIHEIREAAMPWRNALSEDYRDNFIELWWCSTNVMLADSLTKVATPSKNDFVDCLRNGKFAIGIEGKDQGYKRPRPTQRAHAFVSFGEFLFHSFDVLRQIYEIPEAHCPCGCLRDIGGIGHVCDREIDPLPPLQAQYDAWLADMRESD